ncbi:MAG: hypothetical protein SOX50_09945 [Terrisporobacter othiniensis]|nr:hypothetical protein [Terrisporobacter othiniensis]MDY3373582.1 hypothetical protein [Terrisporobacter othiniensis]
MDKKEKNIVKRKPTPAESIIGVLFLLVIIVVGSVIMKLSVELMFVLGTLFVGFIGKRCGFTYKEIKKGMLDSVADNA